MVKVGHACKYSVRWYQIMNHNINPKKKMNRRKAIRLISIPLLAAALMFAPGCASTPQGQQRIESTVKVAAYLGTAEYLRAHPERRKAFVMAVEELKVIEKAETIDFVTVVAIAQRLPVKELKGDRAVIYIMAATIILQDYAGATIPLDKVEQIRPIVIALREGIELGLQ